MKVIDIKFTKEHDSKRQQAQAEMMQKLSERLPTNRYIWRRCPKPTNYRTSSAYQQKPSLKPF